MTEWHRYNYLDKSTASPDQEMVWVVEASYAQGVTVGVFDGFTYRVLPSGSDDCHVTHWAKMNIPTAPTTEEQAAWRTELEHLEYLEEEKWRK